MQACNNISITSQLSACILINISVVFIVKIINNKNRNSCNMNKRIWLINWWFLCCCNDLCDTVTVHVFGSCWRKKTTYHSCPSKLDDSFVHYSMSLVLSPSRVKQFHIHFCFSWCPSNKMDSFSFFFSIKLYFVVCGPIGVHKPTFGECIAMYASLFFRAQPQDVWLILIGEKKLCPKSNAPQ